MVAQRKEQREEDNATTPQPGTAEYCVGRDFKHITPEFLAEMQEEFPGYYDEYKVQRINEMACLWKGKKFEPYTVKLIAMLYQENGQLNASIRGDHGFAFGITQEHICNRGLNMHYLGVGEGVKRYCHWADLDGNGSYESSPWAQVEHDFPEFSHDWVSQFFYFSNFISPWIDEGKTAEDIVYLWNSKEAGRQQRVARHEPFVKAALDIL